MNTKSLLLTAVLGLTSALALANPIWDPSSFTVGEHYLVAGWNFNDATSQTTLLSTSHGNGTLSTNWSTALGNFAGSSINTFSGDIIGRDVAFTNGGATGSPANEGLWLQFALNTTNLENLILTYAGRTTVTGMRDLSWSYSTDGTSFTPFTLVDHVDLFGAGNYGLVEVDFSSVAALNNQDAIFIRGTLTTQIDQSAPTSPGSTRFDNIQFNATAIPEPGTLALIGMSALVLYFRRRLRA